MAPVHLYFLFLLSFHVYMKMSEALTIFVCQKCTKPIGFPSQRRLTKHLREVHGPRLKCDYCDYEYPASRKDNLRRHISIKHKSEESSHTECPSEEQSTDQKQKTESAETEKPLDLSIQNKNNSNPFKGRQDRDSVKLKSTEESSSSQVPQTLLSDTRKVVAKAAPSSGCSTLSFSSTTPAKKITEHKSPSKSSATPHRPNSPSKSSTSKAGKSTQHRSPSRKSSSPRRIIISSSSHKTHTPSKSSKSKPPEKPSGDRSPSRRASSPRRAITTSKPSKSLSEKPSSHRSPSKKSSSLHTTKEPSSSQTVKTKGPHSETERAQKRKSSEKAETSEPKKSRLSNPDRVEKSSSTIQGAGRVRTLSESSTSSSSSSSSNSSSSDGSFSSANDPDIHFGTPPRELSPLVEPFRPLPSEEAEAPATDTFSIREHTEVEVPVTARSSVPTSPASPKTAPDPTNESKEADHRQVSHQPDRNPQSTSTAEERPQRPLSPSIASLSSEFLRLVDITSNLPENIAFCRHHQEV